MPTAPSRRRRCLAAHDRARERRLPLDLPFLVELGLTDAAPSAGAGDGAQVEADRQVPRGPRPRARRLPALTRGEGAAPIRGRRLRRGKGYLTFAVHEHLRRRFGVAPEVTGVELRADLVALLQRRRRALRLRRACASSQGDLRSFAPEAVDVMIALHACDTATDHAIDLGLRAGAAILVCSPCCHKELRPQLARPRLLSAPLLRHGIHLGQEAEMVTDSLRALLLEARGYEAQVFEFVSLEHTSKNKMILARRRGAARRPAERAPQPSSRDLKSFYGIREQCLETLLASEGPPAAPRARAFP